MSETTDLENLYLAHGGTPASGDPNSLPPSFRSRLADLRRVNDADAIEAEREEHVKMVRKLLNQLDSADNEVVKREKRRVIRAELNALRLLENPAE